jgi:hypothetical protein
MKHKKIYTITIILLLGFIGYLILKQANGQSWSQSVVQLSVSSTLTELADKNEQVLLKLTSKCECRKKQVLLIVKKDTSILVVLDDQATGIRKKLLTQPADDFNKRVLTCDMYNVLRRGEKQKVLGYSLYGKNNMFYAPLNQTAKTAKQLYKDWTMRVYYDNSIDTSVICQVECAADDNGLFLDVVDFCNVSEMYMTYTDFLAGKSAAFNGAFMHAMTWRW